MRRILPVLLPLIVFILTGLRGIDFGLRHPDEPFLIRETLASVDSGVYLPKLYNYPSISYWLTFSGLVPDLPDILFDDADAVKVMQKLGEDYYVRVRVVFLLLSALAIVWVYGAVLVWRGSIFEALMAACVLGFSWEFAYHARYIAPDAILVQFVSLMLLLCVLGYFDNMRAGDGQRTSLWLQEKFNRAVLSTRPCPQFPKYLYLAAVAAGLALGTKYTAAVVVVPVGLAVVRVMLVPSPPAPSPTIGERGKAHNRFNFPISFRSEKEGSHPIQGRVTNGKTNESPRTKFNRAILSTCHMLLIGLLLVGTYLITTPGTVLDSDEFWKDVEFERKHYGEIGHQDQTVDPGLDHLERIFDYLGLVGLSVYRPIAYLLLGLMVVGIGATLRENWYLTLMLLSFPVIYSGYLSLQRVMFVRNLLVVLPFMAIFIGRGVGFLLDFSRDMRRYRYVRLGLSAVMAGVCVTNASWLYTTAETIAHPPDELAEFVAYAADNPETQFSVSDQIHFNLEKEGYPLPENMAVSAWDSAYEYGVFYTWEVREIIPPNHHDTISRWFGPHDINLNYYPLWNTQTIIVLPEEKVTDYFVPVFEGVD